MKRTSQRRSAERAAVAASPQQPECTVPDMQPRREKDKRDPSLGPVPIRVKEWRKHRKLRNQAALGELAGLDYTSVGRIERGIIWPEEDTMKRLAHALGLQSIGDLFRDPRDHLGTWAFAAKLEGLKPEDRAIVMDMIDVFIAGKRQKG